MTDWYFLLVPVAVCAVLLLFRFVGCKFDPQLVTEQPYADDVLQDNPLVYYRLQEASGSTAFDAMKHVDGRFGIADGVDAAPLLSGAAAAAYLSLPIASPSQQLGAPSVLPKIPDVSSVRFNGSFVSTQGQGAIGDLTRFTADALVHPEWDIVNERNYYAVIDYSNFVPGKGAPGPNRNAGFAIYAGPDNPSDSSSPICWQLWVGVGLTFARATPLDGGPGPLVSDDDTYVAVQFGDAEVFLWAFTAGAQVDQVQFQLVRPPYLQAQDPDGKNLGLRIGISGSQEGLIPPFPSPPGLIYPFVGRIAEVAVYGAVLDGGRIMSHIVNAFNTT